TPRVELLGDVGHHSRVGGGGGGEHRGTRGEPGQEGSQPAVVGAEVVAPVGDAVGLVDHQQSGGGGEAGQHLVAEVRVVEPFRGDEQYVHVTGGDTGGDLPPLLLVGGVDGAGVDAGPGRGLDLVAHQRQQRRDDHRGPGPLLPQERGGHEVDGGLAPARALHAQ